MILNLLNDNSGEFNGKKLIASGNESLSFVDIDNLLKQTYVNVDKKMEQKNKRINNLMDHLQIFFHGNTHATNFKFMLDFLQVRNPQFENYENAGKLLGQNLKSFREYYVQKAEKFDDRISPILEEMPEDFRYPSLQNYYKISLD
jgi:hypothetical protein